MKKRSPGKKKKPSSQTGPAAASLDWQYFPKNEPLPSHLHPLISTLESLLPCYGSHSFEHTSDQVLACVRQGLEGLGYKVETSKKALEKVKVPVLFGQNGRIEKSFDADAFDSKTGTVLEIEAGRGVTNYQFLKDFFQACMMISAGYLVIAVRKKYKENPDFRTVTTFFETLYASGRLKLPLSGILIVGY